MEDVDRLQDLPDACLAAIFQLLDRPSAVVAPPNSLLRLSSVCKRWRAVIDSAVERIRLEGLPMRPKLVDGGVCESLARFNNLRVLELHECQIHSWPSLFHTLSLPSPHLLELHLKWVLPPLSSPDLDSLFLSLSGPRASLLSLSLLHSTAPALPALPPSLSALAPSLQRLQLSGLPNLSALPDELGQCTALESLVLSNMHRLKTISAEGLAPLVHLQRLELRRMRELSSLPAAAFEFTSLSTPTSTSTTASTPSTSATPLPTQLPPQQRTLSTDTLHHIPYSSPSRHSPSATSAWSPPPPANPSPPPQHGLRSLRFFAIEGVPSLTSLPLSLPSSLRTLFLHAPTAPTLPPTALAPLSRLEDLTISGCRSLATLPDAPLAAHSLPRLLRLRLLECTSLLSLPSSLSALSSLNHLELVRLRHVTHIPPLPASSLPHLTSLHIEECHKLTGLPPTPGDLPPLHHLRIAYCSGFATLPFRFSENLGSCLQTLSITFCAVALLSPASFHGLNVLKHLCFEGCHALAALPDIAKLPALETLCLSGCLALRNLPEDWSGLDSLEVVDLTRCTSLTALPAALDELPSLREVLLHHMPSHVWESRRKAALLRGIRFRVYA